MRRCSIAHRWLLALLQSSCTARENCANGKTNAHSPMEAFALAEHVLPPAVPAQPDGSLAPLAVGVGEREAEREREVQHGILK